MNDKKFGGLKRNSIQLHLYVYFIIIIVAPLSVIGTFSYMKFNHIVTDKTILSTQQLVEQTTNNIDFMLKEIEKVTFMIFANKEIRDTLQKLDWEERQNMLYNREIIQYTLYNFISYRDDIDSVYIIDNKNNLYYNTKDYTISNRSNVRSNPEYSKAIEADGSLLWFETHVDEFNNEETKQVLSASRILKDFDDSRKLGILIVNVEEQKINDIYKRVNLGKTGYMYLISKTGTIISHSGKENLGKKIDQSILENIKSDSGSFEYKLNGQNNLMVYHTSQYTGFTMIGEIPMSELFEEAKSINGIIIFVGIVTIIAAFILAYQFSKTITRPIKILIAQMRKSSSGDFSVRAEINGNNEIISLKQSFNSMIERIDELVSRVYIEQNMKKEAEFQALQAQINPHFLYNTLNSIKWMALLHNMQNIGEMTTSLCNLIYHSMGKGGDLITIGEELSNLKDYVLIQKYRYSDKFDVFYECTAELEGFKTLKLILQPLLENSIFHGIENNAEKGVITVRIFRQEQDIRMDVIDNGAGMTPDKIKSIMDIPQDQSVKRGFTSIGVRNIHERIKLHFGEMYGLTIYSTPDSGTRVEILIPLIK